jgi:cobalt/nickel transport system permease protein
LPDGNWLGFGISFGVILLLNVFASLGWNFTLKRSLVALPFVLVAFSALFSPAGKTLAVLPAGNRAFAISDVGVIRFFSIILRAWLSVQVAALLVSTTPFPDLIHALEHLHLPKILVTMIAFLYRYLFILAEEASRLQRAREARSALLPKKSLRSADKQRIKVLARQGGSLLWRARVTGNMVGQLFLRSYERSERVYRAMLSRGYRGHIRTLNPHDMNTRDWLIVAFAFLAIVFLHLLT